MDEQATPMSGSGVQPRRLGQETSAQPTSQGDVNDYIVPGHPETLEMEANQSPFSLRLLRRRLDTGSGMRRL